MDLGSGGCGTLTDCSGSCKDVMVDRANCGGCGVACGTSEFCVAGACKLICGGDWLACGGTCINQQVDSNNCGTCGNVCANKCVSGACLKVTKGFSGAYAYTTFAATSDGSFRAWGQNSNGTVGDGTTLNRSSPVTTLVSNVLDASSGNTHTCALLGEGSVKCIGANINGQLGNGGTTGSPTAWVVVGGSTPLSRVTQITAGFDFNCTRMSDATVQCWGLNSYGQLGDGLGATGVKAVLPQSVPGLSDVVEVRAGGLFACALKLDKTVSCWGSNADSQLGDGTTTNRLSPVVASVSNAVQLATTANGACALIDDGTVKCWGDGASLATGNGGTATTDTSTPATVVGVGGTGTTLSNVVAISGGFQHYCALLTDTSVVCWGFDNNGQLGDGLLVASSKPKVVTGLTGVSQIVLGRLQSCAVMTTGVMKCWGDNGFGQLGDGSTTDRLAPTDVKF